jgi:hypothetical protein
MSSSRQATGAQVAPRGFENESTETQVANAFLRQREIDHPDKASEAVRSGRRRRATGTARGLIRALKSDASLKRVELRATDEFLSALDALALKENLTRADIIRRGVGLYARMIVEKEKGQFFAVVAVKNGELTVKEVVQA